MADAKLLETFQLGLSSRSTKPEKFVLLKRKGIVWTRCEELGRGSFGVVWLEKARDGERRALKEVEKKYLYFDYNRELLAMAKLSKYKTFFVEILGWYDTPDALCIAMEYFPYGTLQDCISEVTESDVKHIIRQILRGLCYMHAAGFVHRDIKPENIFVSSKGPNWTVKIGDFGLTKCIENSTNARTRVGTLLYQAPEILGWIDEDLDDYTEVVDIWSMGCLTYTLLAHEPMTEREVKNYSKGMSRLPVDRLKANGVSDQAVEFMQALLRPNPTDRPIAHVALQHRWLGQHHRSEHPDLSVFSSNEDHRALQWLYLEGFGCNGKNLSGPEALAWASAHERYFVTDFLFRNGVNINAVDSQGTRRTALHHLAMTGEWQAMGYLLQEGADISAESKRGWKLIHFAAAHGQESVIKFLLKRAVDINMRTSSSRETALHLAAAAGHVNTTRLLLMEGANSNAQCLIKQTPLHCASFWGHVDVAVWLLEFGRADVNKQCDSGKSALRKAVDHDQRRMVDYLLQQGADVHLRDSVGISPLSRAGLIGDRALKGVLQRAAEIRSRETRKALQERQIRMARLFAKIPWPPRKQRSSWQLEPAQPEKHNTQRRSEQAAVSKSGSTESLNVIEYHLHQASSSGNLISPQPDNEPPKLRGKRTWGRELGFSWPKAFPSDKLRKNKVQVPMDYELQAKHLSSMPPQMIYEVSTGLGILSSRPTIKFAGTKVSSRTVNWDISTWNQPIGELADEMDSSQLRVIMERQKRRDEARRITS